MAWLVYIESPRGPSPRVIYDGTPGRGPTLDEADRRAGTLATFELGAGEAGLPIDELVRRYPPPRRPRDASPVLRLPVPKPSGGGVARELEVA